MPAQVANQAERQKDDKKRSEFLVWSIMTVTLASALAYCFLTGKWSSILGLLFIFGFVYWWGTLIASVALASRWIIIPVVALIAVTIVITYSFENTTTFTWQERIGAVARDGWISHSTGRGTASHHGGVDHWIMQSHSRALSGQERWETVLDKFWYLLPIFGISSTLIAEWCVFGRQKE